jgi:hypothetical protein
MLAGCRTPGAMIRHACSVCRRLNIGAPGPTLERIDSQQEH